MTDRSTAAKLRGSLITRLLQLGKRLDIHFDPKAACVLAPRKVTCVRISKTEGHTRLRVSPLGLHADMKFKGKPHAVRLPWHAIKRWTEC